MASDLKFDLELKDGMSAPARQASGSLAQLSSQLKTAKTSLSSYQGQLTRAKSLGDIEGYRKYSALVDGAKRSVFDLTQQVEGLGPKSESSLSMLAGPLGSAATGFVALGTAALAAGVAIGAITFEALKFANEATEAKDHAIDLFQAMGDGSEGAGKRTFDMINSLQGVLPQTRKELTEWTREFEALGVTDLGQLRGQLRATASVQALVGREGIEEYTTLTRKIQAFAETGQGLKIPLRGLGSIAKIGLSVVDVANEMGLSATALGAQLKAGTADATKFGAALESALIKKGSGPLTNLNLQLTTVLSKGWESFTKLFDSIDFRPLSDALHFLFGLMDEGPDHGNTLKDGITSGLNGIVAGLREATVIATVFFLNVETWAIKNKATLDNLWTLGKDGAGLLWTQLKGIAAVLAIVAKEAIAAGAAVGFLIGKASAIRSGVGRKLFGGGPEERPLTDTGKAPQVVHAPAHARGGLVMRPAPGEVFASVAPGERILPREQSYPQQQRYSVAASISEGPYGARSQVRDGGHRVTIERVELHMNAPHGVTDATELSARALAVALERYQLTEGR